MSSGLSPPSSTNVANVAAFRREDDSNPLVTLRKRQTAEYTKICQERRLTPNSGVLHMLSPDEVQFLSNDRISHRFTAAELHTVDLSELAEKDDMDGRRAGIPPPLIHKPHGVHGYDFTDNYLGDKQFLPLGVALAVDPMLEFLIIRNTGLRDNGLIALCEQLKRSKTLQYLDVSGNRFSLGGAKAILALAHAVTMLEEVRWDDTCLDREFCEKRGLRTEYCAVSNQLQALLLPRQKSDSSDEDSG
eukprot:TRINITY_DN17306_c0_g1_i1.p1 TRINITY_DN17306_c0_g1~~TRINITY_DN17306_c0_g1_i1.p1  ORF type:complete len:246 (+),score=65.60 TRINITY_DN17306_c0_g1_i1:133-870(+)